MLNIIKSRIRSGLKSLIREAISESRNLNDYKDVKLSIGHIQSELNRTKAFIDDLSEVEFSAFSQFGDDGIIQYLTQHVDTPNKLFVEFGVEDYRESNTRFLTLHDRWKGLVIDSNSENVESIRKDPISWSNHIEAVHSLVTQENINDILTQFLRLYPDKTIDLLSIDIDGNDYWIWEAISTVTPAIVVVEYNALFGLNPWTIPYNQSFNRSNSSQPFSYYGSSLLSLTDLGAKKGYTLIGCVAAGNNAYFVKTDALRSTFPISPTTVESAYRPAQYREQVDRTGRRMNEQEALETLKGLPVFNTRTQAMEEII